MGMGVLKMAWYIKVEDMQDVLEDIEKRLYACGNDRAVAVVRHAFAWPKKAVFLDETDKMVVSDINLSVLDRVVVKNEKV